jgi:hypothetical protein
MQAIFETVDIRIAVIDMLYLIGPAVDIGVISPVVFPPGFTSMLLQEYGIFPVPITVLYVFDYSAHVMPQTILNNTASSGHSNSIDFS